MEQKLFYFYEWIVRCTYAFKIILILSLFLMSIHCECWREIMINYILSDNRFLEIDLFNVRTYFCYSSFDIIKCY